MLLSTPFLAAASLRRGEVADGVAHLLEAVSPEGHDANHEDGASHDEEDGLQPEAGAGPLEVILDAVPEAVDAVQQSETEEERVEDLHAGLRQALRRVLVIDGAGVHQDVVDEHVGAHQEDEEQPADAHEHPPGQLPAGGVDLARLRVGAWPIDAGHQAPPPKISGTILMSTGMPMTVTRPSTPYHMARWYLTPQPVKSMRMIRNPFSAW